MENTARIQNNMIKVIHSNSKRDPLNPEAAGTKQHQTILNGKKVISQQITKSSSAVERTSRRPG